MSGQWEVVGKKKDKSSKNNASSNNKSSKESNKMMKDIKVEEVLPMSKLNKLYGQGKSNKENQKPQPPKQKPTDNGAAKKKKVESKPQQPPKPKPAKSIEGALSALNVDEFKEVYEKNKALFPDTPIVWLKEMAQFLNKRVVPMDTQDPTYSNKMEFYPLSVMPNALRSVIEKAVIESNPSNVNLFFDITLTTMATEMSKEAPVLGHKFFLQYIATKDPKVVLRNISTYNTLKNSYMNRQNIGLSILWALGQAGLKDFSVGLKVFHEIMYPLMELKNYSRYVAKYLINLINRPMEGCSLQKDQFLSVLDVVYGSKKNVPSDLVKELLRAAPKLNEALLASVKADKLHTLLEPILKKLGTTEGESAAYSKQLCEVLAALMERDRNCLGNWSKLYHKNLVASAALLEHIDSNWKSVSKSIDLKQLQDLFAAAAAVNEELLTRKRKEAGLLKADEFIQKISKKMMTTKRTYSYFKRALILCTVVFCIVFTLDIKHHGSWNDSALLKVLNRTGVYDGTNVVLHRAKECTTWVHQHIEERFPGVTDATVEFTTPYVELGRDLLIIMHKFYLNQYDNLKSQVPKVLEQIDKYAPGVLDQVAALSNKVTAIVCGHFETVKEFLQKEVFVGKLAPENIQKVVREYLACGCHKVEELYQWVYQKIWPAIK